MKILQQYILRELVMPFALCFVTLNFIFMAGYLVQVANIIIGRGVSLWETLYILLLNLPEMINFTMPMSILTAVLIVFGNFSQNNEIRAVKASGIYPLQIMLPAFLIAFGLSLFMIIFNDQLGGSASFQARRMTKQALIKNPKALIDPGRFVELSDSIKFFAKTFDGTYMKDVVIYEIEKPDKPVRTIIAEKGELVSSPDHTEIILRLYDGSVSDAASQGVQAVQFKTYEFSTIGQSDIKSMRKKVRDLTFAEILVRLGQPDVSPKSARELWTAFHWRVAISFGSFIFVFLGIPIAILVRRGEIILSFAISMAMACLYYVLFVGAKTVSIQGLLPPYIVFWLPNLLLLSLGVYFFRKSLAS